MAPPPLEITTTQKFSRKGLGYLWSKRGDLDAAQVSILNCLYKKKTKGSVEGLVDVTYSLARSKAGLLGYGRLYGTKGSLETLEKECRGTLCKDYYYDIDIVNAHPVLLSQFARNRYSTDLPEVDSYIANRDAVLARVDPDRSIAKEEVIRVFYGGIPKHECLLPLSNEVRKFAKTLSQQPEFSKLFDVCKNEKNIYGSFLSYILQTEERACMLAMRDFLTTCGWTVGVLAYDGVMIEKSQQPFSNQVLRDTEHAIHTATGYSVTLVTKEFESYNIPHTTDKEIAKGVRLEAYKAMRESFEQSNFYYEPADQYVKVYPDGFLLFMTREHAKHVYDAQWRFITGEGWTDYQSFLELYTKDPEKKIIRTISFAPSDDVHVYQLPLNLEYLRTPAGGSLRPEAILDRFHTLVSICTSHEEPVRAYLLNWLAHMIQKPYELPGVAIILRGAKGVGKDTLGDFIRYHLIGQHYSTNYESNAQFFDKHDMGRMNKLFVKVEEANRSLFLKNADFVKGVITSASCQFNPKGVKSVEAHNCVRLMLTTNGENPVEMSQGERRWVISDVSSEKKGDFAFWAETRELLFNREGAAIIGDYLKGYDISDFNPKILPPNEYQEEIVALEVPSEEIFLKQWDGQEVKVSTLCVQYIAFCENQKLPHVKNAKGFGMKLIKYYKKGQAVHLRKIIRDDGKYVRKVLEGAPQETGDPSGAVG